jgi:hypothetical protein
VIKPAPHRTCTLCQMRPDPCQQCRTKLGISKEWALSFLGIKPHEMPPLVGISKRDREFTVNAAVKAFKEAVRNRGHYLTGEDHWYLDRAKKELLSG